MRHHANAKLMPVGRLALVKQVLEAGRPVRDVAAGAPIRRQTLYAELPAESGVEWESESRVEAGLSSTDQGNRARENPSRINADEYWERTAAAGRVVEEALTRMEFQHLPLREAVYERLRARG